LAGLDANEGRLRDALEREVWLAAEAPALLRLLGRGSFGCAIIEGESEHVFRDAVPDDRLQQDPEVCHTPAQSLSGSAVGEALIVLEEHLGPLANFRVTAARCDLPKRLQEFGGKAVAFPARRPSLARVPVQDKENRALLGQLGAVLQVVEVLTRLV
jgi:hypothetical protein